MKTENKTKKGKDELPVIGWREWVGLPDLKVKGIKVKVDSGAKTSSLHVSHISKIPGSKKIRFKVHPDQESRFPEIVAEARVIEHRNVKSSNGAMSLRPVIRTKIKMGEADFSIELTLVNRDLMGFRMLLGREAFRNRYLIHSGKSFLLGKPKRKLKKSTKDAGKRK